MAWQYRHASTFGFQPVKLTTGPTNNTGVSSSSLPTHNSKTEHSVESKPPAKHTAKPSGDSHKEKKSKTHSSNKDGSKQAVLHPPPPLPPPPPPSQPAPRPSQPFTDIFGTPIKTRPSSDTAKPKESCSSSKVSAGNKGGKHPPQSSSSSGGVVNSSPIVMSSSASKEHKSKESSKSSKENKAVKRPASPNSSASSSSGKRKRTLSSSSSSVSNSNKSSEIPEKKTGSSKDRTKDGSREKKEKHKYKPESNSTNLNNASGTNNSITNNSSTNNSSSKKERPSKPPKPSSESKSKHDKPAKFHKKPSPPQPPAVVESKSITPAQVEEKAATPEPPVENSDLPMFTPERKDPDLHISRTQTEQSSPASSGSLPSPVVSSNKKGPLFAMMEEMEKESLSPLSSNPGSPLEFAPSSSSSKKKIQISYSDSEPEAEVGVKSERKDEPMEIDTHVTTHNGDIKHSETEHPRKLPSLDPDYLAELVELQRRIMGLDDRRYLQRIVDVIEETGLYQITSSTFDFDLCTLDQKTVRKLQGCLAVK